MKVIFAFVFVLCTVNLFAGSVTMPVKKHPTDSTFIYVYRVGQFGGAGANWAIFLDDQKICKLSNNKYIKIPVTKGSHKISAKIGGVEMFKKETEIDIDATAGGSYYVACNIKSSVMRARLEMVEVTKSSAAKQMENMSLDNCQEGIGN